MSGCAAAAQRDYHFRASCHLCKCCDSQCYRHRALGQRATATAQPNAHNLMRRSADAARGSLRWLRSLCVRNGGIGDDAGARAHSLPSAGDLTCLSQHKRPCSERARAPRQLLMPTFKLRKSARVPSEAGPPAMVGKEVTTKHVCDHFKASSRCEGARLSALRW